MKTCIFFIVLLHSIRTVYCNVTENTVSQLNLKRPKRANDGYTRWKMLGEEVQTEFIVKVLDDNDVTVPIVGNKNAVVGVNYAKPGGSGRRIVGGPVAGAASAEEPPGNDYTRFMPPTRTSHVPNEQPGHPRNGTDSYVDIWQFLTPSLPPVRNENPDRAMFKPRSTDVTHVQYAPVKPVAFQRLRSDYDEIVTKIGDPLAEFSPKMRLRLSPPVSRTTTHSTPEAEIPVRQRASAIKYSTGIFRGQTKAAEKFTNMLEDNYFDVISPKNDEEEDGFYRENIDVKNVSLPVPFIPEFTSATTTIAIVNNNDLNEIDKNKVKEFLVGPGTSKTINYVTYTIDYEINDNVTTSNNKVDGLVVNYEDEMNIKKPSKQKSTDTIVLGVDFSVDYDYESSDDVDKGVVGASTVKDDVVDMLLPNKNISDNKSRPKRLEPCSILNLRPLQFNSSLTLPEIVNSMKIWDESSPIAKWVDITKGNLTTMENPIYMMIVDDPSGGQLYSAKQTVMIVAGVQGRDHHSVAAAMYFLHRLIERTDAHTGLLSSFRFWLIPVFNPDGYEYSVNFPEHKHWKKNLHQNWEYCKGQADMESCQKCEKLGLRCFVQACYGVNLDRNFEYQWIEGTEASEHPCSDVFAGYRQISEVETFALTDYLQTQAHKLDIFIAFKEGDVLGILYPFSHTRKRRPTDQIFRKRANNAVAAIGKHFRRTYAAGQTSEFLPLYAGGIEDWVDGHLNIDLTFAIYMYRPIDHYDTNLIKEDVVQEVFVAVDALLMAKTVEETPGPFSTRPSPTTPHTTTVLRSLEPKVEEKQDPDDFYPNASAKPTKVYLFIMFIAFLR